MSNTMASASSAMPTEGTAAGKSIHKFTVKDIDGYDVELSAFKGKVLLIVNVASACGLTNSNYKELAEVYSELKESGLEILAFPCNQFGNQEPGSNEQIKEFACTRFKAEYPIFDKIEVNGLNTAPVYQFLKASKGGGFLGDSIKWNFGKFLVDQEGVVVERYAPTTSPKRIMGSAWPPARPMSLNTCVNLLFLQDDIKKLLGVYGTQRVEGQPTAEGSSGESGSLSATEALGPP